MAKNLLKIAPDTDVFVHSQGLGAVPQVLNHSILILLIQLRVVVLRILSVGQHLTVSCPNLYIRRPQIAISEDFLTACNR